MSPQAENPSLCGPSCVLTARMSRISRYLGDIQRDRKSCDINELVGGASPAELVSRG